VAIKGEAKARLPPTLGVIAVRALIDEQTSAMGSRALQEMDVHAADVSRACP
jgi:hypothetical protein